MTLGERVQVLEYLDKKLAKVLAHRMAERRAKVLGKRGGELLRTISVSRNAFIHGETQSRVDAPNVEKSLQDVKKICELEMVELIIAVQQDDGNETREALKRA